MALYDITEPHVYFKEIEVNNRNDKLLDELKVFYMNKECLHSLE